MEKKPILAVIVPCFNEEEVLQESSQALLSVLEKLILNKKISDKSFINFIDDGSKDKTWSIIKEFSEKSKYIKGTKLSRNFGHQNTLLAGLLSLQADMYITIDADLQDDENSIFEMVENYLKGFHIVYGVRKNRETDTFFKKATAELYYKFMNMIGINIVFNHGDFRLLSSKAVDALRKFGEENIFLRGLIPCLGFNSAIVYYSRKKRSAGKTKYNLRKMISFAWEGITSFSTFPLKIVTILGFLTFFISILLSIYTIYVRIYANIVIGWASTVLPIYFLGGIQLFSIGIIGEYIGKIYKETKKRPKFIIDETQE